MTFNPNTPGNATDGPTFTMLCCANGAEQQVKQSIAEQGWRLAFSRPGFVTAKHDEPVDLPEGTTVRIEVVSIRHIRVSGPSAEYVKAAATVLSETVSIRQWPGHVIAFQFAIQS